MLTTSAKDDREAARFFVKGERVTMDPVLVLDTFDEGDAVVKGGNAVDPYGNAGVLASNSQGGTVGALLSFIAVRGLPIIMPVGPGEAHPGRHRSLHRLGPAHPRTAAWARRSGSCRSPAALVVTEIEALGILAGVDARHVASGGIGGSEGAVVLLIEGTEKNVDKASRSWRA